MEDVRGEVNMNTKKVWPVDDWERVYDMTIEEYPYEANHEPEMPVIDMRTFTGIVIQTTFMFGDCKYYYVDGNLHREESPAVESLDGNTQIWYVNGTRHRENGPAFVCKGKRNIWYKNGKLHREDGPAVEFYSPPARAGKHEYYLDNKELSKEEWNKKINISRAIQAIKQYAAMLDSGNVIKQNEDLIIIKSKEAGAYCQKCNEFNEYVEDSNYTCYNCKLKW